MGQYRKALEIYPDYAPAAANLVVPLKSLGRFREAIDTGERARALFGQENPGLLYNLALTYLEAGEPVPFLDYMGRLVRAGPQQQPGSPAPRVLLFPARRRSHRSPAAPRAGAALEPFAGGCRPDPQHADSNQFFSLVQEVSWRFFASWCLGGIV